MKGGESALDDAHILELFWQRDERALAETEARYGSYLGSIARRILPDPQDCQESVNDALLRAWNSIPPNRPQHLGTYLGKLARRAAIDQLRRQNRGNRLETEYTSSLEELEECGVTGDIPHQQAELAELAAAMDRWLHTQPELTRVLFLRRYYWLDSLEEAAAFCRVSRSRAASLLYRARKGLTKFLRKEGLL